MISWNEFKWDSDGDLIFEDRAVASLVRHETYPEMYRIKFDFEDEVTDGFWNKTRAKDNARKTYLGYVNNNIKKSH